jgi:hypothetical protein
MSELVANDVKVAVEEEGIRLTPEQLRRRKARSVAIAVSLAVLVALFYVVTIAKIGANIMNRAF